MTGRRMDSLRRSTTLCRINIGRYPHKGIHDRTNHARRVMEDVQMIEFTNSRHIQGIDVSVFDSPTFLYDLIPGQNFLCSIYLMIEF